MSEEKKPRNIPEIQNDYNNLCARAGHLQYAISATAEDLRMVNDQLKELNLEVAAARAAEPKQEEPPKVEEPSNA